MTRRRIFLALLAILPMVVIWATALLNLLDDPVLLAVIVIVAAYLWIISLCAYFERTRAARILAGFAVLAGMGAVVVAMLVTLPIVFFIYLPVFLAVPYGWMLFSYFHYRQGRQAEVVQLLATAAEAGLPLAPALRAYLSDRPRGPAREFWTALLLFFVLPGYYWFWHRRHNFDRKVERVAVRLEEGHSLHDSLQEVRSVVPREALLAVAIGESTGQLAMCLRRLTEARLATIWLELLPRMLYPLILATFLCGIVQFWALFIFPKCQVIFRDFGEPVPEMTARVAGAIRLLVQEGLLGGLYLLLGLAVVGVFFSSTVRWYLPVFGQLYRMIVQSRLLRMLSMLLEAGKTVPHSLALLSASGAFAPEARRRLDAARESVMDGNPLADSLRREGLLRPTMAPLVQAAERMQNLPWALTELGQHLFNQVMRRARRVSLVAFLVALGGVGLFAGFLAIGLFMPMVGLLEALSQ